MVLYLLRDNLNKKLLVNSNGTLKVYHDKDIVTADAYVYDANILCFDYSYLLEFRIQQVIEECLKQAILVNVRTVVLQSLFSTGGTLTGKEKQVEEYISKHKQPLKKHN